MKVIWFRTPYFGSKGESLTRSCINKLRRFCINDTKIVFKVLYDIKKISYFTNNKDPTPFNNKSFVVYDFKCPGCASRYIGKTERTLFQRCEEHGWTDKESAIFKHISTCDGVQYLRALLSMENPSELDLRSFQITLVTNNLKIIDQHLNWNVLWFKEAIAINRFHSNLNNGLKASKELQLF